MAIWLNAGEIMRVNADKFADKMAVKGLAIKDGFSELSFREYDERGCRLANAWLDMGLKKGDRISVLLYNVVEYMEIYLAAAKAGMVVVPINFRWVGSEIEFVVNDSDSRALICSEEFLDEVGPVQGNFQQVDPGRFIFVGDEGKTPDGYVNYDKIMEAASPEQPDVKVVPQDTWVHLYTSGTTGRPKGVIRQRRPRVGIFMHRQAQQQRRRQQRGHPQPFGIKAKHTDACTRRRRPGQGSGHPGAGRAIAGRWGAGDRRR